MFCELDVIVDWRCLNARVVAHICLDMNYNPNDQQERCNCLLILYSLTIHVVLHKI